VKHLTEDQVRDFANEVLKFQNTETVNAGVGQITTFNQLVLKGLLTSLMDGICQTIQCFLQ